MDTSSTSSLTMTGGMEEDVRVPEECKTMEIYREEFVERLCGDS